MKKLIVALVASISLGLGLAVPVSADPPAPACNGLDVGHDQVHGSGTEGELTLHDLRDANHCGHAG